MSSVTDGINQIDGEIENISPEGIISVTCKEKAIIYTDVNFLLTYTVTF